MKKINCPEKNHLLPSCIGLCLLLAVFFFSNVAFSQNLITNGNFESGNGSGFTSNYSYITATQSVQKTYSVVSDPSTINTTWSSSCTAHGGSKMMVVDGSGSNGDKFWEQSPGGGIPVITGRQYIFSYWIQSLSATSPANIKVVIGGNTLTPDTGSVIAPSSTCSWTKVVYKFTSSNGYAQIWLYDNNTAATGNDFAIDDLSLTVVPLPLSISYGVINPSCQLNNDGFITAYGAGGTTPYTYSINGGTFGSSNIFSGLGVSSNNYVTVKDNLGNTASTAAVINITSPVDTLIVRNDTAVCKGSNVTLSVSGGNPSDYTWTASPSDATLTNPTSSTPSVSPVQSTLYTVTSHKTRNLIFNPGFELGNVGFGSDYTYYTYTTNQKAYGIDTNHHNFDVNFYDSASHSGTGNMMIVDGSTANAGNDIFWTQTVPVTPNTDYTFSYWIETVSDASVNPSARAIIETQVNGSPVTGTALTSQDSSTLGWTLVSHTWNSGSNTMATIALYDRNTFGTGNDFAMDDLTFQSAASCTMTKHVTVNIKAAVTSTSNIGICPSELPYSWNGHSYSSGGTYLDTLVSSAGCDSIATLNLTIKATSSSTTDKVVCPAQIPYSWNGNSYETGGTYTVTLVNAAGCDSMATLHLSVNSVVYSTTDVSICPSALPYSWNGNSYSSGGTYLDTLVSSSGCDSVATLNLTIKSTSTSSSSVSICPSELPYSWNGLTFNAAGSQTAHLTNSVGCDSAATLILTVKATSVSTTNLSICPSALPYSWNSLTFNAAGSQTAHLTNSVGCDSAATLILTVKATSVSTTNLSICPSALPYSWNSLTFNAAGSQTAHLTNSVGCDSAATLILTVKATSVSTTNLSICPSALPYAWNGLTFNAAGSQTAHLTNSAGCDSAATLVLSINNVSSAPSVTSPVSYCQNATASALTATGTNLLWYTALTGGNGNSTAPVPSTGSVGTTSYFVSQNSGSCGESVRSQIDVKILANPPVQATSSISGNIITLNGQSDVSGTYLWTPSNLVTNPSSLSTLANPSETTTFTLTVTNESSGCKGSGQVTVTPTSPCGSLNPPNAFTPNNDGHFDKWEIGNLHCIMRMQVAVYNRWGSLVFQSDDYKNDWTGTYNNKPLPDGTYYYVIKVFYLDNSSGYYKGNVTIIR